MTTATRYGKATIEQVVDLAEVRELAASGRARELRVASRLSLADFASAIGVDQSAIGRWESGERRPRGPAALRYLALLRELGQKEIAS